VRLATSIHCACPGLSPPPRLFLVSYDGDDIPEQVRSKRDYLFKDLGDLRWVQRAGHGSWLLLPPPPIHLPTPAPSVCFPFPSTMDNPCDALHRVHACAGCTTQYPMVVVLQA
jgi:hypothetical protein